MMNLDIAIFGFVLTLPVIKEKNTPSRIATLVISRDT
jgi:hypothetical protein